MSDTPTDRGKRAPGAGVETDRDRSRQTRRTAEGTSATDRGPEADLDERLRAVERAVTDDERAPADLSDAADLDARLSRVEDRLDDVESRLAETEAGVEAVRGYVGSVRAVNREVERRADAALAAADARTGGDTGSDADTAGPAASPSTRTGDRRTAREEEEGVRERLQRLL
jgi:hypothetical protein